MSKILVVDDQALVREPMAAMLSAAGYQTLTASGGSEALIKVAQNAPDLILLDLSMPDMSGMDVLKSLRRSAATAGIPVILLTASADRAHVLEAAELGVRDYLLKSKFCVNELLHRVARNLAPGEPPPAKPQKPVGPAAPQKERHLQTRTSSSITDPRAVRDAAAAAGIAPLDRNYAFDRLKNAQFKALPGAVAQLLALINSPRGTLFDVAELIKRDPVLTSQVLRVANSAAYACGRGQTATVEDAVKHIGLVGTGNLIASVGILNTIVEQKTETVLRAWQHALAVAQLMEKFTPHEEGFQPGVAYVVGLCHDLGEMVLEQVFPAEYVQIAQLTRQTSCPRRVAESIVFDVPHSELSSRALAQVGLPTFVTSPIEQFLSATSLSGCNVLARTLRMANAYAHGLLLANGVDESVAPLLRSECRTVFGDTLPKVDGVPVRASVLATAAALAGLSAAQTAIACQPLVPAAHLNVGYVRHSDYADLDPLHELLQAAAQHVEVLPRMPARIPEQMDAMIVASDRPEDLALLSSMAHDGRAAVPVLLLSRNASAQCAATPQTILNRRLPISIADVAQFLQSEPQQLRRAAA